MDYERDGFAGSSGSRLHSLRVDVDEGRLPRPQNIDPRIVGAIVRLRGYSKKTATASQIGPKALPPAEIDRFVRILRTGASDEALAYAVKVAAVLADEEDVFKVLLEPAALRVGELWRADTCTFLDVTMVMSRLQRLFRRLAVDRPSGPAPAFRKAVLLAPAPGEQHNFGLVVVAERFRRRGWTVDFRATATRKDLVGIMTANQIPVVGFSLGAKRLLHDLASIIDEARVRARSHVPAIMVGGRCIASTPHLAAEIGADFAAVDIDSAIEFAESRVSSGPMPVSPGTRSRHGFPHAIPPPPGRDLVLSSE